MRCEGRRLVRWEDGEGDNVMMWQGGKGGKVVRWHGGRMVRQKCRGYLVLFKGGECNKVSSFCC